MKDSQEPRLVFLCNQCKTPLLQPLFSRVCVILEGLMRSVHRPIINQNSKTNWVTTDNPDQFKDLVADTAFALDIYTQAFYIKHAFYSPQSLVMIAPIRDFNRQKFPSCIMYCSFTHNCSELPIL